MRRIYPFFHAPMAACGILRFASLPRERPAGPDRDGFWLCHGVIDVASLSLIDVDKATVYSSLARSMKTP